MSGAKKKILADDVKYLAIPQYETLSVKEIKTFITKHPECLQYLPDEREWEKLPKQYFCNIIHTTI